MTGLAGKLMVACLDLENTAADAGTIYRTQIHHKTGPVHVAANHGYGNECRVD